MSTSGFNHGLYAVNLQGGRATVTLDGSGDGTTSVVFKHTMKNIPDVVLTGQTGLTTGVLSVTNPTQLGFTLKADGLSTTSATVPISYIAFDDTCF